MRHQGRLLDEAVRALSVVFLDPSASSAICGVKGLLHA